MPPPTGECRHWHGENATKITDLVGVGGFRSPFSKRLPKIENRSVRGVEDIGPRIIKVGLLVALWGEHDWSRNYRTGTSLNHWERRATGD